MRIGFEEYFPLTDEQIRAAWATGLFVFDTNVLLGLYRVTESARTDLLRSFGLIQGRIWIPHQVALEYHRRRSIAAFKVEQELSELCNKTKNLMGSLRGAFNQRNSIVASGLRILEDSTNDALAKINTLMESVRHKPSDDPLLRQLADLFNGANVGEPYSEEVLAKKYQEAEERFQKDIPPGYLDARGKSSKPKPRCYNDYVLWSQTLDKIRQKKVPLVFVTNEGDEDWWRLEGADEGETDHGKKRKVGPRTELIREVLKAGAPSYIQLTADMFISGANEYLHFNVDEVIIEQVRRATSRTNNTSCAFFAHTRERLTREEVEFLHTIWPKHMGICARRKLEAHGVYLESHPNLIDAMLRDAIAPRAKVSSGAKIYLQQLLQRSSCGLSSGSPITHLRSAAITQSDPSQIPIPRQTDD